MDFTSPDQERLFRAVTGELKQLGYRGDRYREEYNFIDWFDPDKPTRTAPAATFGQTPLAYDNACFAVLVPGKDRLYGKNLVTKFRALGAPFALEVRDDRIVYWTVGRDAEKTRPRFEFDESEIGQRFREKAGDWSADAILRAKNFGSVPIPRQLDFYDLGLIPALEEQVKEKLGPLLQEALRSATRVYKRTAGNKPDPRELFRVAFWLLAGKVFHDRELMEFGFFSQDSGPDSVLQAVAKYYNEDLPPLLNLASRETIFKRIWSKLDFRNLSVDVLTHIWTNTLVTKKDRQKLGIHPTPRTIARYVVNHLPFNAFEDLDALRHEDRLVVEPCCGSATFLIAAMDRLRVLWPADLDPQERHWYFQKVLVGFEQEAFGVEVSRLCLTLSDFPNRDRWQLNQGDVFQSESFRSSLEKARMVLCNPPFEDIPESERESYNLRSVHKPAEILHRVLESLHPQGVLGFVLPGLYIDGPWYKQLRQELAQRFGDIEVVSLPEKAFATSETETVLLLARQPRRSGVTVNINHLEVDKAGWETFRDLHQPVRAGSKTVTVAKATESFAVPALGSVWERLRSTRPLAEQVVGIHRGIEWKWRLTKNGKETGNREKLVSSQAREGFRKGIPPRAKPFYAFECPPTKYLSMRPEDQDTNAYELPWDKPKVFVNAIRKTRGPWRIAACADFDRLVCYQNLVAIWPRDPSFTVTLAAVLNGPVANAFVASREEKHITNETLGAIPVPSFSAEAKQKIENLLANYLDAITAVPLQQQPDWQRADRVLRLIDAAVLNAYDLPPRLERELLDYFRGSRRVIPFEFGDYFPSDFRPCFSLSEYLSEEFRLSTAAEARSRYQPAPPSVLEALQAAVDSYGE